jgi:hypothetical protein
MDIKIPAELLLPTVEELEERTAKDLAIKWKLRNRFGKKERNAIKQEKDAAKLKAIAGEFSKQEQQTRHPANNQFSLSAINGNNSAKTVLRPTLRAALNGTKSIVAETQPLRKKGRPPRLKPI